MKLRVLKAHYWDNIYRRVGSVYNANKTHSKSSVKRGLCELVPDERRKRDKRSPKIKKLEIK